MQYGKNVSKSQVDYIKHHLNLPESEKYLGVFDWGLNYLLFITSARLISVMRYKIATEIAGNNIASVKANNLGLIVSLREKQDNQKKFIYSIKKEERDEAVKLISAVMQAPAPAASVIKKENEKRILGVRVKMQEIGTKEERQAVDKKAKEERSTADKSTIIERAAIRKAESEKMLTEKHLKLADQKMTRQNERQAQKAARQAAKQARKEAEAAVVEARGKQLGSAYLTYNGGFGSEYKKNKSAFLYCYENEVSFKHRKAPITIPADQITGFEVTGQKQASTTSRVTVTRMVTMGVFSLAAPKRSTVTEKETYVYITLKDGRQLFFHSSSYAPDKVHRMLSDAISRYGSLQAVQSVGQQPEQTQDAAEQIAKFAKLRRQGILTEDEFQAKKKQLLGL